ncbi:8856_t:CDS:2, partial [Entrophospora sp. SA101]
GCVPKNDAVVYQDKSATILYEQSYSPKEYTLSHYLGDFSKLAHNSVDYLNYHFTQYEYNVSVYVTDIICIKTYRIYEVLSFRIPISYSERWNLFHIAKFGALLEDSCLGDYENICNDGNHYHAPTCQHYAAYNSEDEHNSSLLRKSVTFSITLNINDDSSYNDKYFIDPQKSFYTVKITATNAFECLLFHYSLTQLQRKLADRLGGSSLLGCVVFASITVDFTKQLTSLQIPLVEQVAPGTTSFAPAAQSSPANPAKTQAPKELKSYT